MSEEEKNQKDITMYPVKKSNQTLFERYAQKIGKEGFCPFIEPAISKSLLLEVEKDLTQFPLQELEAQILYHAILMTEKFREMRQGLNNIDAKLLCLNAVYWLPGRFELEGEKFLTWPHWILKCLYTDTGIMFGKFWIGEQNTSLYGKAIPEPTCNFLSIRSAFKERDPRLLSQHNIVEVLLLSEDKGQCPFKVMNLPDPLDVPKHLSMEEFYTRLKKWSEGFTLA